MEGAREPSGASFIRTLIPFTRFHLRDLSTPQRPLFLMPSSLGGRILTYEFGGTHSDCSKWLDTLSSLCTAARPQTFQGHEPVGVQRARWSQGWVAALRWAHVAPDKASITPFIIEMDFSPIRITKIYPSYFELGMCRSTKITVSVRQQGQSEALMLRNLSGFILSS